MTKRHNPLQQLKEAKQLARDYGLFVVEKAQKYLVYRENQPKNIYLGQRGNPASLRTFVGKLTGS